MVDRSRDLGVTLLLPNSIEELLERRKYLEVSLSYALSCAAPAKAK